MPPANRGGSTSVRGRIRTALMACRPAVLHIAYSAAGLRLGQLGQTDGQTDRRTDRGIA